MKRYVSLLIETGLKNGSYTSKNYLKTEPDNDLSALPQAEGTNYDCAVQAMEKNYFVPVENFTAEEIALSDIAIWNVLIFNHGGNYDRGFVYQKLGG